MQILSSYKIFTAAFLSGCFFLCSCENDRAQVNHINNKAAGVEQATDIRINYSMGGKAKALLTAPLMLHVDGDTTYYEFPKTLYAEFYNNDQQRETKLTALYGKYRDGQNIIYLRDSVKIINMLKGDTIYCDDLWWDRSRKDVEFYTDKKVRIRQKDGQFMNGTGMEASQNFKNYHIINMGAEATRPIGVFNSKGDGMPTSP